MDFEFPEDALMLRDMLRRFIQKEARPLEMSYFNLGELKPEEEARLRRSIEQLGLIGYLVPEEFGGFPLDLVTACVIEEELGGTFLPLDLGNPLPLLYACQDEQVGQYLEPVIGGARKAVIAAREPGPGGVDPANWTTTATQDGETFTLNGRKALSVVPGADDFLILLAKTDFTGPPMEQTAFLVELDTPGLSVNMGNGKNGAKITLDLQDCQVSSQQLLGEPGGALRISAGDAPKAWILMGARYVGLVERLIEMSTEHARDWISLGAPLSVRPAIQRALAEMRVDAESARWLVYHAAWLADTAGPEQVRAAAALVRLATGDMLKRCIDRATLAFAGPGPSPEIEPRRMVQSVVPIEALDLALDHARAAIANQVLSLDE